MPLWYIVAGGILWLAAELVFRGANRAGWTAAMVMVASGAMRLAFDHFLATKPHEFWGLTLGQWVAALSLCLGIILTILCALQKTPIVNSAQIKETRADAEVHSAPMAVKRSD